MTLEVNGGGGPGLQVMNDVPSLRKINQGYLVKTELAKDSLLELQAECRIKNAKKIAEVFYREIKAASVKKRRSPSFVKEIYKKLVFLHDFHQEVKEKKKRFPFSKILVKVVVEYIQLEHNALYSSEGNNLESEKEVESRIINLIETMFLLYDKKPAPTRCTYPNSLFVLKVLYEVASEYRCDNNLFGNLVRKLLKKLQLWDAVQRSTMGICNITTSNPAVRMLSLYDINEIPEEYDTDDDESLSLNCDLNRLSLLTPTEKCTSTLPKPDYTSLTENSQDENSEKPDVVANTVTDSAIETICLDDSDEDAVIVEPNDYSAKTCTSDLNKSVKNDVQINVKSSVKLEAMQSTKNKPSDYLSKGRGNKVKSRNSKTLVNDSRKASRQFDLMDLPPSTSQCSNIMLKNGTVVKIKSEHQIQIVIEEDEDAILNKYVEETPKNDVPVPQQQPQLITKKPRVKQAKKPIVSDNQVNEISSSEIFDIDNNCESVSRDLDFSLHSVEITSTSTTYPCYQKLESNASSIQRRIQASRTPDHNSIDQIYTTSHIAEKTYEKYYDSADSCLTPSSNVTTNYEERDNVESVVPNKEIENSASILERSDNVGIDSNTNSNSNSKSDLNEDVGEMISKDESYLLLKTPQERQNVILDDSRVIILDLLNSMIGYVESKEVTKCSKLKDLSPTIEVFKNLDKNETSNLKDCDITEDRQEIEKMPVKTSEKILEGSPHELVIDNKAQITNQEKIEENIEILPDNCSQVSATNLSVEKFIINSSMVMDNEDSNKEFMATNVDEPTSKGTDDGPILLVLETNKTVKETSEIINSDIQNLNKDMVTLNTSSDVIELEEEKDDKTSENDLSKQFTTDVTILENYMQKNDIVEHETNTGKNFESVHENATLENYIQKNDVNQHETETSKNCESIQEVTSEGQANEQNADIDSPSINSEEIKAKISDPSEKEKSVETTEMQLNRDNEEIKSVKDAIEVKISDPSEREKSVEITEMQLNHDNEKIKSAKDGIEGENQDESVDKRVENSQENILPSIFPVNYPDRPIHGNYLEEKSGDHKSYSEEENQKTLLESPEINSENTKGSCLDEKIDNKTNNVEPIDEFDSDNSSVTSESSLLSNENLIIHEEFSDDGGVDNVNEEPSESSQPYTNVEGELTVVTTEECETSNEEIKVTDKNNCSEATQEEPNLKIQPIFKENQRDVSEYVTKNNYSTQNLTDTEHLNSVANFVYYHSPKENYQITNNDLSEDKTVKTSNNDKITTTIEETKSELEELYNSNAPQHSCCSITYSIPHNDDDVERPVEIRIEELPEKEIYGHHELPHPASPKITRSEGLHENRLSVLADLADKCQHLPVTPESNKNKRLSANKRLRSRLIIPNANFRRKRRDNVKGNLTIDEESTKNDLNKLFDEDNFENKFLDTANENSIVPKDIKPKKSINQVKTVNNQSLKSVKPKKEKKLKNVRFNEEVVTIGRCTRSKSMLLFNETDVSIKEKIDPVPDLEDLTTRNKTRSAKNKSKDEDFPEVKSKRKPSKTKIKNLSPSLENKSTDYSIESLLNIPYTLRNGLTIERIDSSTSPVENDVPLNLSKKVMLNPEVSIEVIGEKTEKTTDWTSQDISTSMKPTRSSRSKRRDKQTKQIEEINQLDKRKEEEKLSIPSKPHENQVGKTASESSKDNLGHEKVKIWQPFEDVMDKTPEITSKKCDNKLEIDNYTKSEEKESLNSYEITKVNSNRRKTTREKKEKKNNVGNDINHKNVLFSKDKSLLERYLDEQKPTPDHNEIMDVIGSEIKVGEDIVEKNKCELTVGKRTSRKNSRNAKKYDDIKPPIVIEKKSQSDFVDKKNGRRSKKNDTAPQRIDEKEINLSKKLKKEDGDNLNKKNNRKNKKNNSLPNIVEQKPESNKITEKGELIKDDGKDNEAQAKELFLKNYELMEKVSSKNKRQTRKKERVLLNDLTKNSISNQIADTSSRNTRQRARLHSQESNNQLGGKKTSNRTRNTILATENVEVEVSDVPLNTENKTINTDNMQDNLLELNSGNLHNEKVVNNTSEYAQQTYDDNPDAHNSHEENEKVDEIPFKSILTDEIEVELTSENNQEEKLDVTDQLENSEIRKEDNVNVDLTSNIPNQSENEIEQVHVNSSHTNEGEEKIQENISDNFEEQLKMDEARTEKINERIQYAFEEEIGSDDNTEELQIKESTVHMANQVDVQDETANVVEEVEVPLINDDVRIECKEVNANESKLLVSLQDKDEVLCDNLIKSDNSNHIVEEIIDYSKNTITNPTEVIVEDNLKISGSVDEMIKDSLPEKTDDKITENNLGKEILQDSETSLNLTNLSEQNDKEIKMTKADNDTSFGIVDEKTICNVQSTLDSSNFSNSTCEPTILKVSNAELDTNLENPITSEEQEPLIKPSTYISEDTFKISQKDDECIPSEFNEPKEEISNKTPSTYDNTEPTCTEVVAISTNDDLGVRKRKRITVESDSESSNLEEAWNKLAPETQKVLHNLPEKVSYLLKQKAVVEIRNIRDLETLRIQYLNSLRKKNISNICKRRTKSYRSKGLDAIVNKLATSLKKNVLWQQEQTDKQKKIKLDDLFINRDNINASNENVQLPVNPIVIDSALTDDSDISKKEPIKQHAEEINNLELVQKEAEVTQNQDVISIMEVQQNDSTETLAIKEIVNEEVQLDIPDVTFNEEILIDNKETEENIKDSNEFVLEKEKINEQDFGTDTTAIMNTEQNENLDTSATNQLWNEDVATDTTATMNIQQDENLDQLPKENDQDVAIDRTATMNIQQNENLDQLRNEDDQDVAIDATVTIDTQQNEDSDTLVTNELRNEVVQLNSSDITTPRIEIEHNDNLDMSTSDKSNQYSEENKVIRFEEKENFCEQMLVDETEASLDKTSDERVSEESQDNKSDKDISCPNIEEQIIENESEIVTTDSKLIEENVEMTTDINKDLISEDAQILRLETLPKIQENLETPMEEGNELLEEKEVIEPPVDVLIEKNIEIDELNVDALKENLFINADTGLNNSVVDQDQQINNKELDTQTMTVEEHKISDLEERVPSVNVQEFREDENQSLKLTEESSVSQAEPLQETNETTDQSNLGKEQTKVVQESQHSETSCYQDIQNDCLNNDNIQFDFTTLPENISEKNILSENRLESTRGVSESLMIESSASQLSQAPEIVKSIDCSNVRVDCSSDTLFEENTTISRESLIPTVENLNIDMPSLPQEEVPICENINEKEITTNPITSELINLQKEIPSSSPFPITSIQEQIKYTTGYAETIQQSSDINNTTQKTPQVSQLLSEKLPQPPINEDFELSTNNSFINECTLKVRPAKELLEKYKFMQDYDSSSSDYDLHSNSPRYPVFNEVNDNKIDELPTEETQHILPKQPVMSNENSQSSVIIEQPETTIDNTYVDHNNKYENTSADEHHTFEVGQMTNEVVTNPEVIPEPSVNEFNNSNMLTTNLPQFNTQFPQKVQNNILDYHNQPISHSILNVSFDADQFLSDVMLDKRLPYLDSCSDLLGNPNLSDLNTPMNNAQMKVMQPLNEEQLISNSNNILPVNQEKNPNLEVAEPSGNVNIMNNPADFNGRLACNETIDVDDPQLAEKVKSMGFVKIGSESSDHDYINYGGPLLVGKYEQPHNDESPEMSPSRQVSIGAHVENAIIPVSNHGSLVNNVTEQYNSLAYNFIDTQDFMNKMMGTTIMQHQTSIADTSAQFENTMTFTNDNLLSSTRIDDANATDFTINSFPLSDLALCDIEDFYPSESISPDKMIVNPLKTLHTIPKNVMEVPQKVTVKVNEYEYASTDNLFKNDTFTCPGTPKLNTNDSLIECAKKIKEKEIKKEKVKTKAEKKQMEWADAFPIRRNTRTPVSAPRLSKKKDDKDQSSDDSSETSQDSQKQTNWKRQNEKQSPKATRESLSRQAFIENMLSANFESQEELEMKPDKLAKLIFATFDDTDLLNVDAPNILESPTRVTVKINKHEYASTDELFNAAYMKAKDKARKDYAQRAKIEKEKQKPTGKKLEFSPKKTGEPSTVLKVNDLEDKHVLENSAQLEHKNKPVEKEIGVQIIDGNELAQKKEEKNIKEDHLKSKHNDRDNGQYKLKKIALEENLKIVPKEKKIKEDLKLQKTDELIVENKDILMVQKKKERSRSKEKTEVNKILDSSKDSQKNVSDPIREKPSLISTAIPQQKYQSEIQKWRPETINQHHQKSKSNVSSNNSQYSKVPYNVTQRSDNRNSARPSTYVRKEESTKPVDKSTYNSSTNKSYYPSTSSNYPQQPYYQRQDFWKYDRPPSRTEQRKANYNRSERPSMPDTSKSTSRNPPPNDKTYWEHKNLNRVHQSRSERVAGSDYQKQSDQRNNTGYNRIPQSRSERNMDPQYSSIDSAMFSRNKYDEIKRRSYEKSLRNQMNNTHERYYQLSRQSKVPERPKRKSPSMERNDSAKMRKFEDDRKDGSQRKRPSSPAEEVSRKRQKDYDEIFSKLREEGNINKNFKLKFSNSNNNSSSSSNDNWFEKLPEHVFLKEARYVTFGSVTQRSSEKHS